MAPDPHSESGDYAAEAAGVFPPFDPTYFASQLFWLAISFAVLYILLSRLVLPRIGGVIEERKDKIADDLDAAAQLKAQADETVAAYEKELTEARARGSKTAAEAKAEADAEIAEAIAEADRELDQKLTDSEHRIAELRAEALAQVRSIASDTAIAVAEHIAGLDVDAAAADKAVDKVRG
jgi:F-type H+-transporting ATPase subunit b